MNVAYYHQKFNGFIYHGLPSLYLEDNGSGTHRQSVLFTSNPDAVVNGVDLDTGFRFTRQWSFDLAASYSNGHLTGQRDSLQSALRGHDDGSIPAGHACLPLPVARLDQCRLRTSILCSIEYDMPVPNTGIDGFIRGLYTFYGRNPHASEFYVAPSYGLSISTWVCAVPTARGRWHFWQERLGC